MNPYAANYKVLPTPRSLLNTGDYGWDNSIKDASRRTSLAGVFIGASDNVSSLNLTHGQRITNIVIHYGCQAHFPIQTGL